MEACIQLFSQLMKMFKDNAPQVFNRAGKTKWLQD